MANPTYRGVEMPVLLAEPQWAEGVKLNQIYRTAIREALDTSEDRQQSFPRGLWKTSFQTVQLSAQETGNVRKLFERLEANPVGCPLWPHRVPLTASILAGVSAIPVEYSWSYAFSQLPYAVVMDDLGAFEVVRVSSLSDDGLTINLAAPTVLAWTYDPNWKVGARILPLIYGLLIRPASINLQDEVASFDIQFEERFLPGVVAATTGEIPTAPTLTITTEDCGQTFTLTWTEIPGATSYCLQKSSLSPSVWDDVVCVDCNTTMVSFTNVFGGSSWRVRGVMDTGPSSQQSNETQAQAATIEPCAIAVTNTTDISDNTNTLPPFGTTLGPRRILNKYVSVIENPLVALDSVYLTIDQRLDYYYDPDAIVTSAINVTCPTPSVRIRWATDGSDPIDSPTLNDHTLPHQDGFGCIVKARAFTDACAGPITTVLVDKRVESLGALAVQAQASSISTSCSRPIFFFTEVMGVCVLHVSEAGDDCKFVFPGVGATYSEFTRPGMIQEHSDSACASLAPAANPSRYINYYNRDDFLSGGSYPVIDTDSPPCITTTGGGNWNISTAIFYATGATFTRGAPFWDAAAQVHTNTYTGGCDLANPGPTYLGADDVPGPSGVSTTVSTQLTDVVLDCRIPCSDFIFNPFDITTPVTQATNLSVLQLIQTREKDDPIFNPQP